jgi:hypothetical protein
VWAWAGFRRPLFTPASFVYSGILPVVAFTKLTTIPLVPRFWALSRACVGSLGPRMDLISAFGRCDGCSNVWRTLFYHKETGCSLDSDQENGFV